MPRVYVRVWADVVGTGNSGGCYDYGGIREQQTGYELVEWIARQPWSSGLVGMIGGSYNGTTAKATAVMQPPHLATIVPEAAIDRWYDYAYSGGIRSFDIVEKPQDYTSRKGHPIGVTAQTDNVEWSVRRCTPAATARTARESARTGGAGGRA